MLTSWCSSVGIWTACRFSIPYLIFFDVRDGECGVSQSAERHDGDWLLRGDPGGVPKSFFMIEIEEFLWD
ncbi:hypothetical protein TNCV_578731 [Trichonephila clavipes]|nr:hypothetical protein TNCV_578731 [Trichonephila clavipes]